MRRTPRTSQEVGQGQKEAQLWHEVLEESRWRTFPLRRPLGFETLTTRPQGPSVLRRNASLSKLFYSQYFSKLYFNARAREGNRALLGPWWVLGEFLVLHEGDGKGGFERRGHKGYFSPF